MSDLNHVAKQYLKDNIAMSETVIMESALKASPYCNKLIQEISENSSSNFKIEDLSNAIADVKFSMHENKNNDYYHSTLQSLLQKFQNARQIHTSLHSIENTIKDLSKTGMDLEDVQIYLDDVIQKLKLPNSDNPFPG